MVRVVFPPFKDLQKDELEDFSGLNMIKYDICFHFSEVIRLFLGAIENNDFMFFQMEISNFRNSQI